MVPMIDESLVSGDFVEVIGWTGLAFLKGVVIRINPRQTHFKRTRASPLLHEPVSYRTFEILCIKTGKIFQYDDLYYTIRRIE
jgi:hypothetical protein